MNPSDVYREFVKTGSDWADAQCEASQLEDQLKPMLASLTIAAKAVDGVGSMRTRPTLLRPSYPSR